MTECSRADLKKQNTAHPVLQNCEPQNCLARLKKMTARSAHSQIASCSASKHFPMLEWILIAPSPMFWRINVELTFPDLKKAGKADADNDSASDVERFVLVTFQSQAASLSDAAKQQLADEQAGKQVSANASESSVAAPSSSPSSSGAAAAPSPLLQEGSTYMYSAAVTEWKDLCRENVVAFTRAIRARLQKIAPSTTISSSSNDVNSPPSASDSSPCWWFDAVDPATGQPLETSQGPSLYSESDAIEQLLRLPVVSVGFGNSVCRLVQHPKHGMDVYPSSMFFVGPRDLIVAALNEI